MTAVNAEGVAEGWCSVSQRLMGATHASNHHSRNTTRVGRRLPLRLAPTDEIRGQPDRHATQLLILAGFTSSGAEEGRTPDLCIANAALSQLSYRPSDYLGPIPSLQSYTENRCPARRWTVPILCQQNRRRHAGTTRTPAILNRGLTPDPFDRVEQQTHELGLFGILNLAQERVDRPVVAVSGPCYRHNSVG
jgi:hypothetical protein